MGSNQKHLVCTALPTKQDAKVIDSGHSKRYRYGIMNDRMSDDERIEAFAEEISQRFRNGERPHLKEYLGKFVGLESRIERIFVAIQSMEAYEPESELTRVGLPPTGLLKERIGDFQLKREIGRGGMGVVYEAEQISLSRRVALKVLPKHDSTDPRRIKRFEIEARSAAALHHTNITPIFAVGEDGGVPYYAMQYIDGPGLDRVIREIRRQRAKSDQRYRQDDFRERINLQNLATTEREDHVIGVRRIAEEIAAAMLQQQPANESANAFRGSRDSGGEEDLTTKGKSTQAGVTRPPKTTESTSDSSLKIGSKADWRLFGARNGSTNENPSEMSSSYWQDVARIGVQVAEALEHAHVRGVLHRDIKPSNLMMDINGVVWVTDFGLAKATDQEGLTRSGELVGTLRYLSPEQFSGKSDARSDVFSLGLTLYELSTLRPAYAASENSDLLEQVTRVEVPAPRKIDADIPHDLETIILKSLNFDPGNRYQSAGEMAADLVRYLRDEPILARRETWSEKLKRWRRRNPSVAKATYSVAAIVTLALVMISYFWLQAEFDRQRAEESSQRATALGRQNANLANREKAARQEAETQLYVARMNLVEQAFGRSDWAAAMNYLQTYSEGNELSQLAGVEWRLWNEKSKQLLTFVQDHRPVFSVAVTDNDSHCFSVGMDGLIQHWDLNSQQLLDSWEGHDNWISQVELLNGGSRIVTSSYDGTLKVWDVESRKLEQTLVAPDSVRCFAISPDEGELVSGQVGGTLVRWSLDNGSALQTIDAHDDDIYCIAQSSDGSRMATGSSDRSIKVWNRKLGEPVRTLKGHEDTVRCVVFDDDDSHLFSGSNDTTVRYWNLGSGQSVIVDEHESMVYDVDVSHDGKTLATCGRDEMIHVWNRDGDKLANRRILHGHFFTVYVLRFSSDGESLYSAAHDKTVKSWNLAKTARRNTVPVLEDDQEKLESLETVAIGPDGTIATGGSDPRVFLYDINGSPTRELECESEFIYVARFSTDGRWLVCGDESGNLWCFDSHQQWTRKRLDRYKSEIRSIEFSPTGDHFAVGLGSGDVVIHSTESREQPKIHRIHDGKVFAVAWSPDGRSIASAGEDEAIRIWEPSTGTISQELKDHQYRVYALSFDPNSGSLYSGGRDGKLRRWNVTAGELEMAWTAHSNSIHAILLTSDGKSIITAGTDRLVRIWHRESHELVCTLDDHEYGVLGLASDQDNELFVTVGADDVLRLWHAPFDTDK